MLTTLQISAQDRDATAVRDKALKILRHELNSDSFWVKVHAAEFLINLGQAKEAETVFLKELETKGNISIQRIGIWRVLARSAEAEQDRRRWTNQLRDNFVNREESDRSYALESLGKLNYQIRSSGDEEFTRTATNDVSLLGTMATWVLANSGVAEAEKSLVVFFNSPEVENRGMAAYAFRFRKSISPTVLEQLIKKAQTEKEKARIYFVEAAFLHSRGEPHKELKKDVVTFLKHGTLKEQYEACSILALKGVAEDIPLLTRLLDSTDGDVRASAAHALLCLERTTSRHPLK
ncbi:MAG: hypothetical protein ABIR24_14290 [Verrucomicrobiota bacterium]